jgi:hypothetical protein
MSVDLLHPAVVNCFMVGNKQWQELGSAVSALAADVVRVQERLDAAHAEEQARFVELLAALPESGRSLVLPLLPRRLAVTEHRVSCSVRVATSRGASLSLRIAAVNAGFEQLYKTTKAETSTLTIEVASTPKHPV